MGLKKPSTGGGLPSDVVDYSGKQATFSASTTDYDGTNIRLHSTPKEKTLLDTASTVTATAPLSSFGDATAADVVKGKTFTGAAGLAQEGTLSELGELIGIDAYPEVDGEYLVLGTLPTKKCVMDTSASIQVKTALSNLGDASAADVAAGKTFTSAAGVKVAGTGKLDATTIVNSFSPSTSSTSKIITYSSKNNHLKLTSTAGEVAIIPIKGVMYGTSYSASVCFYGNYSAPKQVTVKLNSSSAFVITCNVQQSLILSSIEEVTL